MWVWIGDITDDKVSQAGVGVDWGLGTGGVTHGTIRQDGKGCC